MSANKAAALSSVHAPTDSIARGKFLKRERKNTVLECSSCARKFTPHEHTRGSRTNQCSERCRVAQARRSFCPFGGLTR